MTNWADVHAGTLIVDGLDCSVPTSAYALRLDAAGVGCMHLTTEDMDARGGIWPFQRILSLVDAPDSRFRIARTAAEIEAIAAGGHIALVLGRQASDPIHVEHGTLSVYHALGLRITGIAYNAPNRYGGGCLTPQAPLTEDGAALVAECHRLGILLDVGGHTGEQTSLDAIARADGRPVVCTHTGAGGANPNPRNASDKVCEAIAATGGVIGVVAISDYLVRNPTNAHEAVTPTAPLAAMLDHLDHLKRLVGAEHLGLGPDFIEGLSLTDPAAYPLAERFTPDMISDLPDIEYVTGFESIDRLSAVTQSLLGRGWTVPELRGLLGGNWLRVYRAAWDG
jgi:membrane dipeptidase